MPARTTLLVPALVLAVLLARPACAQDIPLQLAVTLNGYATGKIAAFVQRGKELFVTPQEWAALGLRLPASVAAGSDGRVALSRIAGLGWRLDAAGQALALSAPDALLVPTQLARAAPAPAGDGTVESGLGVTLNYDISGQVSGGVAQGSGLLDLRGFSPWGTASTGLLAYAGPLSAGNRRLVRLDSGFAYADPDSLRRYRAGDFIDGGLNWTRPVRMGGLQIQSDFSIRPDLITFPLPVVSGTAAVPSTVDVMVNNTRLLSQPVAPGPFETSQLPVVTGAGSITTTVTNALGRQVTATLPFYASNDLLTPDLQSYSLEVGWVRRDWGLVSDEYRQLAGAATYRRGVSDWLTLEAHGEGAPHLAMAGMGAALNAFDFGTLDLAVAGSLAGGSGGGQVSLGFNRLARDVSFGVSAIFADNRFRDIAAINGAPAPTRQVTANVSLALGRWGAVGLAYTGIRRDEAGQTIGLVGNNGFLVGGYGGQNGSAAGSDYLALLPAQHAEVLSASYSVQVETVSFYATGFRDFAGGGTGVLAGIALPLGPRSSASLGGGAGGDGGYGQFQAVQSPVEPGDWGYQAYANSNPGHEFAEGQYKSGVGLASAGIDRLGDTLTGRAEARGALSALAGGGVHASNTIADSFAVVDTNGQPGIAVMEENRVVGRTDADGRILVPDLRAFDANHIAIDPDDVPVNDRLDGAGRTVRPQDRSGVVVRFPLRREQAAIVRLTDAAGKPLPLGGSAMLEATRAVSPMGYDGIVYIENLAPSGNRLTVTRPDGGRCGVTFDFAARDGTIPSIGPLVCAEPRP